MSISEVVALLALGVSLMGLVLSARREVRTSASALAGVQATLENIRNGVDEIRIEQRLLRERTDKMAERMASLEEGCKALSRRLDTLERKEREKE